MCYSLANARCTMQLTHSRWHVLTSDSSLLVESNRFNASSSSIFATWRWSAILTSSLRPSVRNGGSPEILLTFSHILLSTYVSGRDENWSEEACHEIQAESRPRVVSYSTQPQKSARKIIWTRKPAKANSLSPTLPKKYKQRGHFLLSSSLLASMR